MIKLLVSVVLIVSVGFISAQVANHGGASTPVVPGSFEAVKIGGVENALRFPGADLGVQVNEAVTALKGKCGSVVVPNGDYVLSTKIAKPRCVILDFQNSVVTSTITSGSSISTGSNYATDTTVYTLGGIKNLKLIGPSSSAAGTVGIWIGGDVNNVYAPAGSNDFLDTFENITVQNFESGMEAGIAYQDTFRTVALAGNKYGYKVDGQFGGENMNMFGMEIVNNGTYGFYAPNMPASEYTCTACSIDYNGTGQAGQAGIYIMNGHLNLYGGHMEQCGGYFVDGPVTTSAAMVINMEGVQLVAQGTSTVSPGGCPAFGTDSAYIHVTGYNSSLVIGGGTQLIRNHPYRSVINWTATGLANTLHVEPIMDPGSNPGLQVIPTAQAANIYSLDMPLYDQYVPNNQYSRGITVGQAQGGAFPGKGSIFATGFIGASVNQGGNVPAIDAFPFGGGYIGWNFENIGDVDLLSPVPVTTYTVNAFNFYVNSAGKFQKAFSIQHNGGFRIGTEGKFGIDGSGDASVNSISLPSDTEISSTTTRFSNPSISIGPRGSSNSWTSGMAAPTGNCTTGDLWSNRSGEPFALYVCQSGAWVGK